MRSANMRACSSISRTSLSSLSVASPRSCAAAVLRLVFAQKQLKLELAAL